MEDVLGALLLAKLLERGGGNHGRISNDLKLIYSASKARIYQLADKIARHRIKGDIRLVEKVSDVPVPTQEKWDFNLGDRVRIKFSLEEFKSIAKQTMGWNKKLTVCHSMTGIVVDMHSQYVNAINIYFPDTRNTVALYAGLFEKLPPQEATKESIWKFGDIVKTDTDVKLVQIMQMSLPDIPPKCIGKCGKVIAVVKSRVFVTFDGFFSYIVHSGLLKSVPGQSEIRIKSKEHFKGFEVGEKVQVIANLKKLILNQRGHGGWNADMHILLGNKVIITDINDDDTIDVKFEHSRRFRLNSESVVKLSQPVPGRGSDLEIMPGEKVRVDMIDNIRGILDAEGIPLEFLEMLTQTAVIHSIDEDMDGLLRYNCDQKISVNLSLVKKVPHAENVRYNNVQAKLKLLKAGDTVRLDVGPPRFVREVLVEMEAKEEIISALTNPAVVKGFTDRSHAIIEYGPDRVYKVNKKYLTIPY